MRVLFRSEKIVAVGGHPGRAGDAGVLRRTAVPAVAAICVSCEGGDDAVRVDAADLAAVGAEVGVAESVECGHARIGDVRIDGRSAVAGDARVTRNGGPAVD